MPDMLQRLHQRLDPLGAVSKKMFGGVCFMLNGNMVAGTSKRGTLVRTGKVFGAMPSDGDGRQGYGWLLACSGKP
jgi:hypothetical protein